MIHSPAQYEFVKGDIADIRIDGGILPLRGDDGVLRGEDICFLMEAAHERCRLYGYEAEKSVFTKMISSNQMNKLDGLVFNVCYSGRSSFVWINADKLTERPMDEEWYGGLDAQSDIVGIPEYVRMDRKTSGDVVSADHLRRMFDAIKLRNVVNDRYAHDFSFDWHTTTSGDTGGSTPTPLQAGNLYRYDYGDYGTISPESDYDYTQTANPATITISASPVGREGGLSSSCDKIELWCSATVQANRVVDNESQFSKWSYALLKVGESVIEPGAQSVTIDATHLSSRAASVIQSIIGFTPSKPVGTSYAGESSYIRADHYFIFKHLRDKTKWY